MPRTILKARARARAQAQTETGQSRVSRIQGGVDLPFLMLTIVLVAIGLVMLLSASYPSAYYDLRGNTGGDPLYYFKRQGVFALVGFGVMYVVSKLNYRGLKGLAMPILVVACVLMLAVHVPGLGHSSGGNLVAGICMRLGETGLFRPCCALMDYSPLDLATDPADKERSLCDMPADRARDYNQKYIAPEQAKEPYTSPVYAGPELLEHFPDTLIISAGEDSLCMEDEEFALHLIRAGVAVTARRYTRSVHGFVVNRMCEWEDAMELNTRFIRQHI